jgi:hypothetical protein
MTFSRESKFLSENLLLSREDGRGVKYRFVFPRSRPAEVDRVVAALHAAQSSPDLSVRPAALAS